jgi:hypothetical protein
MAVLRGVLRLQLHADADWVLRGRGHVATVSPPPADLPVGFARNGHIPGLATVGDIVSDSERKCVLVSSPGGVNLTEWARWQGGHPQTA